MTRYFETKEDALAARKIGDKIYHDAFKKMNYITTPNKSCFWNI